MPSINPPSWRGVSTPSISPLNYVAQGLRALQQSTTALSENLAEIISTSSEEINKNKENSFKLDIVEAQNTIERSDKLKRKIQTVLKSNEEVKVDMKQYLEECKVWGQSFEEECRKLDTQITIATKSSDEIVEFNKDKNGKVSNASGIWNFMGKNLTSLRAKWATGIKFRDWFSVLEHLNANANNANYYYELVPYY